MSRLRTPSSTRGSAADEPWRSILGVDAEGGQLQLDEQPREVRISASLACNLLKRGISSKAIGPVGEFLGVGKAEVADMLDIDRGTVARWTAKDQPLPTYAAEGLLRLLELDQLAVDTFETEVEARHWLRRPHPLLEGEDPLSAAKTSYGAQRVKDILTAVRYGGVA